MNSEMKIREKWVLLTLGVVLSVLGHYRWGVELVSWFAMVPFLIFTMKMRGWKDSLLLFAVIQVALNATTFKIVTDPIPGVFAFMFGVPAAVSLWVLLLIWNWLRKRISYTLWIPLFVAMAVIGDWSTFEFSSFGMWGTSAVSQVNNLELLQVASLGGITIITALMAAVAMVTALFIADIDRKRWYRSAAVTGVVLVASLIYGSARVYTQQNGRTVRAAAVTTNLHLDASGVFPESERCIEELNALFERSSEAVQAGAEVIVWNEGATLLRQEEESDAVEKGKLLAKEWGVDLVMAYIVLLSEKPFQFDNKFVWISSEGEELESYRKHHPVPGEPCIAGTGELNVHNRPWGNGTGAICYDYDFPSMAREQGRKEAGLSVVPSSDWYGIDPYHTRMARIRAIEGGFSVIRPVRWAASEAFDAYGRIRGSMPYHEGNRVMVTDLPTEPVDTLYSRVGDWPVWFAFLVVLVVFFAVVKSFRKK